MQIKNKQLILKDKTFNESDIYFNAINYLITRVIINEISPENNTDDNSSSFLSLIVSEIMDCNDEESSIEF